MRPDIWEIVDYAHEKGAMPVIGTNATLITEEIAQQMADHGIPRISVSVDFPTAEEHDEFRGQPGCFDATIEGIKMAKRHGVGVQINMTVTTLNADKVEAIHDLAESLGIDAFHIFMLVPTGRGSDLLDKELPPEEYEKVLRVGLRAPEDEPAALQAHRRAALLPHHPAARQGRGQEGHARGVRPRRDDARVSRRHHVLLHQPHRRHPAVRLLRHAARQRQGAAVLARSGPSRKVFNDLRDYSLLKGKCGACEYKAVCGGCRARALEVTGDYLEAEPYCVYEPPAWKGECEVETADI